MKFQPVEMSNQLYDVRNFGLGKSSSDRPFVSSLFAMYGMYHWLAHQFIGASTFFEWCSRSLSLYLPCFGCSFTFFLCIASSVAMWVAASVEQDTLMSPNLCEKLEDLVVGCVCVV